MPVAQTTSMNILVERRGRVARLVINRPPLNILDLVTLRELRATLDAALNDSEVRMVEFFGAGEKAFSAGTDIRDHVPERAPEMLREFHSLIRAVLASHCPRCGRRARQLPGRRDGAGSGLRFYSDLVKRSFRAAGN
jgi:enoyl-CoA hydratase/carnithine racemase